jgi:signal transduction histidine kinase
MPRVARVALGSLALAAVYFLTARLGLTLATVGRSVTLVWPPTGLALAVLVMHGRALWPGIAVGAFAVNALTPDVPPLVAAAIALGNTAEALLGAALLRQSGFELSLRRVTDVLKLVVLAGVVSTMVSAVIGTLSLRLGGLLPPGRIPATLRVWWTGDLMGVLIVTPLLLSARDMLAAIPRRERLLEALLLAAALIGGSVLAFHRAADQVSYFPPHMLFPLLLWAALRFGPRGAAWANLTVSVVAVWATINQVGPFARPSLNESLLLLDTFMAMMVLTALVLGAAGAERADAVQAREDFISIASHELRTPLTPLTLQLDRLRRMLSRNELGIAEVTKLQASLERQATRLTTLVDILLDVTRLRVGPMRLRREKLDLSVLARETVDGLADHLRLARCELTLETAGPIEGLWDRVRVQQAITNLLTNAIKYGDGKPISVSVGRDQAGKRAQVVVKDQGPGIGKRDQARLFKRFQRLPPTGGNAAGGLGLGLYITRQIIEAHGGTVRLDSRPGAGATFTCALPLVPAKSGPQNP